MVQWDCTFVRRTAIFGRSGQRRVWRDIGDIQLTATFEGHGTHVGKWSIEDVDRPRYRTPGEHHPGTDVDA
jgi:hypothetical protein